MPDNIIGTILTLMQNDTEDPQKQSDLIEFYYDGMDEKGKKAIDIIMTSACGYSLDTIINHPENIEINNDGW